VCGITYDFRTNSRYRFSPNDRSRGGNKIRRRCFDWREANGFSQSDAVKVLNETGIGVTLDSLQNWEVGRWSPRANVALALADFLRQNPKLSKKSPRRHKPQKRRNRPMDEAHEELKPLTSIQLLDAAIWREIGSDEPQTSEALPGSLDAHAFPSTLLYATTILR
jgi:hypothetical protein